jgi:hypothetical protein
MAQVLGVLGRGEQEFTLNHYVAEDAWPLLLWDRLLQVLVLQDKFVLLKVTHQRSCRCSPVYYVLAGSPRRLMHPVGRHCEC